MTHGFDAGGALKSTLEAILSRPILLVLAIDSKSLYDCLVKLETTKEKRLMVDIMVVRQSYERREIADIIWILGTKNPADAMTKQKPSGALDKLIETKSIVIDTLRWAERELKKKKSWKRSFLQCSHMSFLVIISL